MKKVTILFLCFCCAVMSIGAQKPYETLAKLTSNMTTCQDCYVEYDYAWYEKKKPTVAAETMKMKIYMQGNEKFWFYDEYAFASTPKQSVAVYSDRKTISVKKTTAPKTGTPDMTSPEGLAALVKDKTIGITANTKAHPKGWKGLVVQYKVAQFSHIDIWYDPATQQIKEMSIHFLSFDSNVGQFKTGDILRVTFGAARTLAASEKKSLDEFVVWQTNKWVPAPKFKGYKVVSG